jgi:hypothetical protein
MKRITPFLGPVILSTIVFALGALTYHAFLDDPQKMDAKIAAPKISIRTDEPNPIRAEKRSDVYYKAITDRPLFEPTRRPISTDVPIEVAIEPIAPAQEPEITPNANIKVYGILKSGTGGSALLSANDAERQWIGLNEKISGWTLKEISSEWVKVINRGDAKKIWLYEND